MRVTKELLVLAAVSAGMLSGCRSSSVKAVPLLSEEKEARAILGKQIGVVEATKYSPDRPTFLRHIDGKDFLYSVSFTEDSTVSQLHPTSRVWAIRIKPDAHEKWSSLIGRIPEVRSLCAAGCKLQGEYLNVIGTGFDWIQASATIHACPLVPIIRKSGANSFVICAEVPLLLDGTDNGSPLPSPVLPVQWSGYEARAVWVGPCQPFETMKPEIGAMDDLGEYRPS